MLFVGYMFKANNVAVGLIPQEAGPQPRTVGEAIANQRAMVEKDAKERATQELKSVKDDCASAKPDEIGMSMTWPKGYSFRDKQYPGPCEAMKANGIPES